MSLLADVASYLVALYNESREFLRNATYARLLVLGLAILGSYLIFPLHSLDLSFLMEFAVMLLTFFFGVTFVLIAPFRIWRRRESKLPHVKIVFHAPTAPYLQELAFTRSGDDPWSGSLAGVAAKPVSDTGAPTFAERRFRVGVMSDRDVDKARVLLSSCKPDDAGGVFLGHALNVMGLDPPTGEFLLRRSEREPSVYIDVVAERFDPRPESRWAFFCYARPGIDGPLASERHSFVLKLEAGGAVLTERFTCEQTAEGLTMQLAKE